MTKSRNGTADAPKIKSAGFRSRRQSGPAVRRPNNFASKTTEIKAAPSVPARSAPPLPKQNKGRFFVGTIFFSFFAVITYTLWTVFFQYQSYGIVQGRLIAVSSPWDGVVINWRVKEGEQVKQGQPLAEISNLEMRHQLDSLLDDLKLNQAQLEAESAKLHFETRLNQTSSEKAYAEFLEASGNLESESALLEDLTKQLQRARRLIKSKNYSQQKYDKLYFEYIGQKRKAEKLQLAVAALKNRHQLTKKEQTVDRNLRLQPMLTRIETIQSEIERLREKILQGMLLAPVSGRVTRRFMLTGESIKVSEPAVELLEDGSAEAILYVPQERSDQFLVGDTIALELPPFEKPVHCEVLRLSDQMETPPQHIGKYYAQNTVLLPIHMKPLPEYEQFLSFRINGTVKLPIDYQARFIELLNNTKKTVLSLAESPGPKENQEQYPDPQQAVEVIQAQGSPTKLFAEDTNE